MSTASMTTDQLSRLNDPRVAQLLSILAEYDRARVNMSIQCWATP